jgi:hypothetical protein
MSPARPILQSLQLTSRLQPFLVLAVVQMLVLMLVRVLMLVLVLVLVLMLVLVLQWLLLVVVEHHQTNRANVEVGRTVRVFRQKFTLEDAIGSHACSLQASGRVTNSIQLRSSLSYQLAL